MDDYWGVKDTGTFWSYFSNSGSCRGSRLWWSRSTHQLGLVTSPLSEECLPDVRSIYTNRSFV